MPISDTELRELLRERATTGPAAADRRAQIHHRIHRVRRRRAIGTGVAGLAIVVAVALTIGLLPRSQNTHPAGHPGRTTATLVPYASGGTPTRQQLDAARTLLLSRFAGADLPTPTITVQANGTLTLDVAAGIRADRLRMLTAPGRFQIRGVLTGLPDQTGRTTAATDPPGQPAPTLASVKARVGLDRYNFAAALGGPPPQTAQTDANLAPFATLTPAEVAVLPQNIQMFAPTISCAQLAGRDPASLGISDHDPGLVACDVPGFGDLSGPERFMLGTARVGSSGVTRAHAGFDGPNEGGWYVEVDLTAAGQAAWSELTFELKGLQVAFLLDGTVINTPEIQERLTGPAILNGSYVDRDTAAVIASVLNTGVLPVDFGLTGYSTGS